MAEMIEGLSDNFFIGSDEGEDFTGLLGRTKTCEFAKCYVDEGDYIVFDEIAKEWFLVRKWDFEAEHITNTTK